MDDTAKYRITAMIATDGVVERSDVVGAVYGQTEGLLGDELDLRSLQRSAKVSRLNVEIESENGQSVGTLEIGSRLDKPETAILAAALETIEQIGPCSATVEVQGIDDVRTAKRREVADRAKELLAVGFQDGLDPEDIIAEVRESVRTEAVTTYEGLPSGPGVATGGAIVVVEGRADVRRLLSVGIRNAIAVEGTDVPEAVATLSRDRTTTALLDGDRGGKLLLRELRQVADVDYVAFVPEGRSVENLDSQEVRDALREKTPVDSLPSPEGPVSETHTPAADDASVGDVDREAGSAGEEAGVEAVEGDAGVETDAGVEAAEGDTGIETDAGVEAAEGDAGIETDADTAPGGSERETPDDDDTEDDAPETLAEHVVAVRDTGTISLLGTGHDLLERRPMEDAFDAIETAEPAPTTVVLDGTLTQRLLDVASQRGVGQVIARGTGEFAKQPADVRVRLTEEFALADA
jgi:DNA primase